MTGNADGWQEDKRRLHHGPPIFLVVWLLVFAPLFIWSDDALAANSTVRVVALEGALGPAKADFIIRQLHQAEDEGIAALILRIDTPGGLDASMRELTKAILGAEIPVVSFVAPNGARAASAGTYIVMASHIAAMAPATNIGSSTPVQIGGAPDMPRPRPDLPGSSDEPDGNESQDQAPDAMTRKTVNDAAAYIQSIAETRGRNVEWAALTVRESVNVRATEAVRLNVVDLIADDLPDLLRQIDGRQVTTAKGKVTLDVAQAIVEYAETDWRHDLLEIISDPSIAYGLLMIGIWGLVLEFYSPGMILPSVVGIVCLVLGAYGLQLLPVNVTGVALILLGIAFMIAEAVSPGVGVFGIVGLIAFVIGSMILLDTESPEYQLPVSVILGFTITAVIVLGTVVGFAMRSARQAAVSGLGAMVGQIAQVVEGFEASGATQTGRVITGGEIWDAVSQHPTTLKQGDTVRITAVDGLTLMVEEEA